jgi:hypothetical protein
MKIQTVKLFQAGFEYEYENEYVTGHRSSLSTYSFSYSFSSTDTCTCTFYPSNASRTSLFCSISCRVADPAAGLPLGTRPT